MESPKAPLCNGPGRPLLAYGQFTSREVSAEPADGGINAERSHVLTLVFSEFDRCHNTIPQSKIK